MLMLVNYFADIRQRFYLCSVVTDYNTATLNRKLNQQNHSK